MEQHVDIILKETITESVRVDEHLTERIRDLLDRALDEAEMVLDFGVMGDKMSIIRTLLSAGARSVGRDFATPDNDAKLAVERLFLAQREIEHAPQLEASPSRTDDPDEGTAD